MSKLKIISDPLLPDNYYRLKVIENFTIQGTNITIGSISGVISEDCTIPFDGTVWIDFPSKVTDCIFENNTLINNCILTNSTISDSCIIDSTVSRSKVFESSVISRSNISYVTVSDSMIYDSYFRDSRLDSVSFEFTNCEGSTIKNSQGNYSRIMSSKLSGCYIGNSFLRLSDIKNNRLRFQHITDTICDQQEQFVKISSNDIHLGSFILNNLPKNTVKLFNFVVDNIKKLTK